MKYNFLIALAIVSTSCGKGKEAADASGTFETDEILVSAEIGGNITSLRVEEGQTLVADSVYGQIDSVQLFLKLKQLMAQKRVIQSKRPDVNAQISVLYAQLDQAKRERLRIENLYQGKAATEKQRDDARSAVEVIQKQIVSLESVLGTSTRSLDEELNPLQIQIEQVQDQLRKCRIVAPVNGIVLAKFLNKGEMATPGKPMFKLADMNKMYLRAYITGDQFVSVKLGQQMEVRVDDGKGGFKLYKGQLTWISNKAEFTPKTIQTKDERANLVYAIKVNVVNDGYLKSGMYGEIKF